jgi:hypothetical protein
VLLYSYNFVMNFVTTIVRQVTYGNPVLQSCGGRRASLSGRGTVLVTSFYGFEAGLTGGARLGCRKSTSSQPHD